jgi:hypothetical protein
MEVKHKLQWIPPTPANDKLTRSQCGSLLHNQEGRGLWWVSPALSSQRHPTHGSNLSSPLSKKTFPWDVKPGDLTSCDRFLLCSRLNKNMGIVAYHQSGDAYKLSSMTKKTQPAHSRKTLNDEKGDCDNCQSGVSTNSSFPYMKACQIIH